MRFCKVWMGTLIMVFTVLMSIGPVAAAELTTYQIDFKDPEAVKMIEIPYPAWNFTVKTDPFGDPALHIPRGSEDQRGPSTSYGSMRFFVLNVPNVDNFELTWEVMGGGGDGENRSQAILYSYQDLSNWYFTYLTYTDTTRVTRVVDGKQQDICAPKVAGLWPKNMTEYHQIKQTVTTEGGRKVFRTFIDGNPVGYINQCYVPTDEYKPGKVGIGGLSYSTVQAQYIKNIKLTVLP